MANTFNLNSSTIGVDLNNFSATALFAVGTHVLGIKDMAGLCKPYAAYALVKALREEVGVPIHFHTHDTSGISAPHAGLGQVTVRAQSQAMTVASPPLGSFAFG